MAKAIKPYEYFAFISYKREDEKWAKWLQHKLEYYKLPSPVKKDNPDLPEKIRPVFKDTTDLEPGVLAQKIQNALYSSKFLIVICSPRSANSIWVSKEVQSFIDSGRSDHIIPFIIGGTPNATDPEDECYPEGLRQLAGEQELLGANINEMGRDAAAIKVVARMFNLRFDTLWQRYKKNIRKKQIIGLLVAILSVILFWGIYNYVLAQKHEADRAISERDIQMLYSSYLECEKQFAERQYLTAFNNVQSIMRVHTIMPDSLHDRYEYILRMSYQKLNADTLQLIKKYKAEFNEMDWGSMPVTFDETNQLAYIGCSGFSSIRLDDGKKVVNPLGLWPQDIKLNGDNVICFDYFKVYIIDKNTFKIKKEIPTFYQEMPHQDYIFSSNDGSRFLTREIDNQIFNVWDTNNGNIIQSFNIDSNIGSLSGDGRIFATIENEKAKLYYVDTRSEVPNVSGYYATDLQFDQSGKWLLLYLGNYDKIRVINYYTGEDYMIPSDEYDVHKTDWGDSYNFDGSMYANKYYVSEDGEYIAIGKYIYNLTSGKVTKQLKSPELAQGVLIYNDAKRLLQINYDRSVYVYARAGSNLFKKCNIGFSKLRDNDKSTLTAGYDIIHNNGVVEFMRNNKLYGEIKNLYTDIYHISISKDGRYALISQLSRPTTLYSIKTGLPIEEYPFISGDGDIGFGVINKNNLFYFNTLSTVVQYNFRPVNDLLNLRIER